MIEALLNYRFLQYAVYASILISMIAGIIGTMIVEKKLVMMTGGIAHTSYGGVGIAFFFGIHPLLGAFAISLLSALGISYIKQNGKAKTDVTVGLFWSLGMALGVLFIALTPGYPPNVGSYLFGNILTVTSAELVLMVVSTFILLFAVLIYYHYWMSYLFDDEFASLIGIRAKWFEYALFSMIAIAVVATIKVVGIILVIALFTAPTATASLFTRRLKTRMIASILISLIYTLTGLFVSYVFNLAAGASIVVLAVTTYMILALVKTLYRKRTAQ